MTGNKNRLSTLAVTALLVMAAFAGGPATVSAEAGNSSIVDSLFAPDTDNSDVSSVDRLIEAAKGTAAKYVGKLTGSGPEEASAKEYANATQSTFNANSDDIENWTNTRTNASEDYDAVRVKLTDDDGNSEWMFVVSDLSADGKNYTNMRAMNLSEFRDTNREVDATYRLSEYASRNANSELETFITDYVRTDSEPGQKYLANLAGKYGGEVSGDELPGDN